MKIDITQEDIDNGKPQDPCRCAASVAIARSFEVEQRFVSVFKNIVILSDDMRRSISFPTPPQLLAFIEVVDSGGKAQPLSFDLDFPEEALVILRHGKDSQEYSDWRSERLKQDASFFTDKEVNAIDPTSTANADAERSVYHGGDFKEIEERIGHQEFPIKGTETGRFSSEDRHESNFGKSY